MFDWEHFLQSNRIDYEQEGGRNIKTHCPFCSDDPSKHMIISTEGRGWKCWRDTRRHSGVNPTKLVAALLRCSYAEAARITGSETPDTTNFLDRVKSLLTEQKLELPKLQVPSEFRIFSDKPSCRPFLNYLKQRGHTLDDALAYNLKYAVNGQFSGRIIFSMYLNKQLIGWTGRAIGSREPRYLTNGAHNHSLMWFDKLKCNPAKVLLICEGPFDALKVNVLGAPSIKATCFGTTMPSSNQVNLLYELAPLFDHAFLMLDDGTTSIAMEVLSQLRSIGIRFAKLPEGVKDPGELTKKQLHLTIKTALDK